MRNKVQIPNGSSTFSEVSGLDSRMGPGKARDELVLEGEECKISYKWAQ